MRVAGDWLDQAFGGFRKGLQKFCNVRLSRLAFLSASPDEAAVYKGSSSSTLRTAAQAWDCSLQAR